MIPERVRWTATIIIGSALAVAFAYSAHKGLGFLETITFAQLLFTILAFGFIFYTLYVAIVQLRKSMARPQIKVAFGEDGKTETTLNVSRDRPSGASLDLWVINRGNAVTRTFQIDVEVPNIFTPKYVDTIMRSKLSSTGDKRIYSFYNDGNFPLFVNSPVKIPEFPLPLEVNPDYYEKYPNKFDVEYKVFGDWAETQEGKLRIICNKE